MKQGKDWGEGYSIRECGQRWRWHLSKDQVTWEASHAEERSMQREQSEAKGPWQDIVGCVPGRWGRQLVQTVMVLWRLPCTSSPLSELKNPQGLGDERPQRGRTPGQRSARIQYTCSQRNPWVYLRASWFFRRLVCVCDHNAIFGKNAFLKSAVNFRVDVHLDSALLLLH